MEKVKKYFLISMFQNKFGEAPKFYDEKGWHWMLPYDQPILFDQVSDAEIKAQELSDDLMSEIIIKEIDVFNNVWELILSKDESDSFIKDQSIPIIFERMKRKEYILLTTEKTHEKSNLINGLYLVDRKNDTWIYCSNPNHNNEKGVADDVSPQSLILQALQHLEEAKAIMQIMDYDMTEIKKIEGVLMFIKKISTDSPENNEQVDTFSNQPLELIQACYDKLEEAKAIMQISEKDPSEISKLDGVMMFVKKIM